MKAVLKISNLNSSKDINAVKSAIISNEGIMACQISKSTGDVNIVFDKYFTTLDEIIESIENAGYIVI